MQQVGAQEDPERPLSPHYWGLKKILDDAGVELIPSDRDLAPYDGEEEDADRDGDGTG